LALCGAGSSAVGCGLDQNGLLAEPSQGDASALDAARDGTSATGEGGPGEAGGSGDGGDGATATDDGGATGDSSLLDTSPPPDASPAPVIYDGGVIADPTFDDNAWVPFCVGVTACFDAGSISECMGRMPQPLDSNPLFPPPALIACVASAGSSCGGVASCFGAGGPCTPQTQDTCNGQTWTTCRLGAPVAVDCTQIGMVCSPEAVEHWNALW
jgi:hypothetical protein